MKYIDLFLTLFSAVLSIANFCIALTYIESNNVAGVIVYLFLTFWLAYTCNNQFKRFLEEL